MMLMIKGCGAHVDHINLSILQPPVLASFSVGVLN